MLAYRIVNSDYAASCINGEGAKRSGGRWNSKGHPVIYAGTNPSLCVLEMLVHLQSIQLLRAAYVLIEANVPDDRVNSLPPDQLPADWQSPENDACKRLGDSWLAAQTSVGLLVPSAVLPMERNLLLNPDHPDFRFVATGEPLPLSFDPRLP